MTEQRNDHRPSAAGRGVRTFLAIPLPPDLLEEVRRVRNDLARSLPGIRWVNPETVHLTLRFFGEIPEESLEKIEEIMVSVGSLHPPFETQVAGIGAFPSPARPRVIWLGVKGSRSLGDLHADFERSLEQIGIPAEDRPFSPHLTLGRCRKPTGAARPVLEKFSEVVCGVLPVDRVVLFESRLRPEGAVHLPLKTVFLGKQGKQ